MGGGRPSVPPLRRRRGKSGRRVQEAAPYKRVGGRVWDPPLRRSLDKKRRAHNVRPYRRGGGNLAPHPPQCAHWGTCPYPLCPFGTSSLPLLAFGHFPLTGGIGPLTRGVGPQGEGLGKTKRDRSETCPLKHRGETQFRIKFLCFLSFSKKGSPGSEEPGLLAYCFSSGPLVSQPRGFLIAAWARATET